MIVAKFPGGAGGTGEKERAGEGTGSTRRLVFVVTKLDDLDLVDT